MPRKESPPVQDPKSVGIWIRVSTEDQAKGESPEHHERRARLYCESKGWQVRETYHLEGISGKAIIETPEAQRMLRDIKSGRITGLVFSKLARLARNTRELLELADLFRDHGADLISLHESIDTSTPAGRLFFTVVAALAQFEREEIAERVAASVPIRAKLGKPLGGAAPFGYKWENRQLIPDPKESPVRKLMYELFREHRRKKTVARLMNQAGHRTRNGSKFSDTTVERLIRDPTAKGSRRANYTQTKNNKKAWELKPESEWVISAVEPIISEELWTQCVAILDERKQGRRPAKKAVHLFSGLAICVCGNKMYVPSNTPKYVCFKCRTKISTDDLEAVFHDQLKGFFLSPEEIAAYVEQADETIREKLTLIQTLETERRKTQGDMEKILRLYMTDQISPEGFGRQNRPLETRLNQLEDEIPRLQAEADFLKIQHLSSDQILTEARDVYARWPSLPNEEKRGIIEAITERVTIGKDEVSIDLLYLPSASEFATNGQRNLTDSSRRPS